MLVKEVKPIGKFGKDLLKCENSDEIIDRIIELPLRKACKIFKNKNIETNMSSSNKNNLLKRGKKRIEKEDLNLDDKIHYFKPNFLSVGKGYAWIMMNYDKLSNENKDKIYELKNRLGDNIIWLVYAMYYAIFPKNDELYDEYKKRFDEDSFRMVYNRKYPQRAVFIRMPINDNTSVEEVEKYFCEIASEMLQQ